MKRVKAMPWFWIPAFAGITLSMIFASSAQAAGSVYMEDMTWMEIRDAIAHGSNIVIVPTGGTEQNGPHMVAGKHNFIVHYTSGEIAKRLGNALVAPVIAYVPEGRIQPPEGHMQFPGTISVRYETFEALLEDAASSLKQNGFKLICFVGDHGGNQEPQAEVAQRLTDRWTSSGVRVLNVSNYYSHNGQEEWVDSIGLKVPNPSAHAGLIDTSELMAIDPSGVRDDKRGVHTENDYQATGAMGDSSKAAVSHGKHFLSLKVDAAVEQITHAANATR